MQIWRLPLNLSYSNGFWGSSSSDQVRPLLCDNLEDLGHNPERRMQRHAASSKAGRSGESPKEHSVRQDALLEFHVHPQSIFRVGSQVSRKQSRKPSRCLGSTPGPKARVTGGAMKSCQKRSLSLSLSLVTRATHTAAVPTKKTEVAKNHCFLWQHKKFQSQKVCWRQDVLREPRWLPTAENIAWAKKLSHYQEGSTKE